MVRFPFIIVRAAGRETGRSSTVSAVLVGEIGTIIQNSNDRSSLLGAAFLIMKIKKYIQKVYDELKSESVAISEKETQTVGAIIFWLYVL